jgi:hypothetical protein
VFYLISFLPTVNRAGSMISQYLTFVLDNHLYWNGGTAIPENSSELINYTDDSSRLVADPQIPAPVNVAQVAGKQWSIW